MAEMASMAPVRQLSIKSHGKPLTHGRLVEDNIVRYRDTTVNTCRAETRADWVSEFAPRRYQKPLSYTVGWLCALGWQAAMPSVAYLGAQQVLALISVCNPSYVIQGMIC